MFIIDIQYKKPIEVVEAFLAAHREFLEQGYQKNYFVASGPKNPRNGGIIVSQLKDKAELEAILKHDPFILNDIAEYHYTEFTPVKYHKDFAVFI
jgi:uncharacterized protein YciI